jgi:hypothetical protein
MFGAADRTLSNIPRPPSSRVRVPFWNPQLAQNELAALTDTGALPPQPQPPLRVNSSLSRTSSGVVGSAQQQRPFSASRRGSAFFVAPEVMAGHAAAVASGRSRSEFRAQSIAQPPPPLRAIPMAPRPRDAAEAIIGPHRTAAEYVRSELDTFEVLKRRHLALTLERDKGGGGDGGDGAQFPDLEVLQLRLQHDRFESHQREKEIIRQSSGRRFARASDGFVNFRGRTYVRYVVPLESTMTRTLRWLFDLRELNVHPVTRMMREAGVAVEYIAQEWLVRHVGNLKEAGLSIPMDAMQTFIQEHVLRTVYVTQAQCQSWYELLCDKKGTSLDFASAMTKLSLILPAEIDDTISAWYTRMFFSGAFIMFRVNDNATPSEFFHIVDALETLVDGSLKRGSIEHHWREPPASVSSGSEPHGGGGGNNANNAAAAQVAAATSRHLAGMARDEFSTNTPQGIMRLLAVVRADIEAYAAAVNSRAVRRVEDVLAMFTPESTLPRLMRCGEYAASTARYQALAAKRLQAAKHAREKAITRSRSILFGRKLSGEDAMHVAAAAAATAATNAAAAAAADVAVDE